MFLELDKDDIKEIVKQIGTVKQLQGIQSQQKKSKVRTCVCQLDVIYVQCYDTQHVAKQS